MTIETLEYNGKKYPKFQEEGFASQFAIPFAKHVCKGKGVDIGAGCREWSFPGSYPIDLNLYLDHHALDLPMRNYDYIFSSHLLEHLETPWTVLDYWYTCLKTGGVLFLYLPDVTSNNANPYHLPWNNKKHKNIIEPAHVYKYMTQNGYENVFLSGTDLNSSFMIFGEKK